MDTSNDPIESAFWRQTYLAAVAVVQSAEIAAKVADAALKQHRKRFTVKGAMDFDSAYGVITGLLDEVTNNTWRAEDPLKLKVEAAINKILGKPD